MEMSNEPVAKRPKTDEDTVSQTIDIYINKIAESMKNLQAVVSDDLYKPLPLIKVYIGHAKNPKDLSRIISILNEKVPLKELQHLKRVRKREVLLCPTHFLNGMSSIQEYLEFHVQELKDVFEYFKEIDVPLLPPRIKKQYNSFLWSCNFHPNKYYEKLVSDDFFNKDELRSHRIYMHMAFEVARWYLERDMNTIDFLSINATVIVDPVNNSIVAVSFYNADHPIQHSAMLAIDNVAKTQYGGAWGETSSCATDCTLNGLDKELMLYLQQMFPAAKFGARMYRSKSDDSSELPCENLGGPYLCTGYYVYMLKEPCVMCSMALVHARAKRIFFCFDNLKYGALKSRTKLQTVSSLNHHFEVFTGFL